MELKEAKNILEKRKSLLINSSMPDIGLVTAIDTVLNELDKLQTENEFLKALHQEPNHLRGITRN